MDLIFFYIKQIHRLKEEHIKMVFDSRYIKRTSYVLYRVPTDGVRSSVPLTMQGCQFYCVSEL